MKNQSKKNALAIGVIASSAFLGAAVLSPNTFAASIGNPSFMDQNFYECVVRQYDASFPGEITIATNVYETVLTDAQLAKMQTLNCDFGPSEYAASAKIANSAGIDKLSNLQTLYLSDNSLTSINLSQNKKLVTLRLDNNSLASLDLSNNVNLETLLVANNPIQEIDISNNTSLSRFYISDSHVITAARARKADTGYGFNMSSLAWFAGNTSNWSVVPSEKYSYNSTAKSILIPERDSLADGFRLVYIEDGGYPDSTITISANPAELNIHAYLNIDTSSDSESVMAIDGYVDKYIGENWDSDEYLNVLIEEWKERGVTNPKLVKVEAFNYGSSYRNTTPNVDVGISDGSTSTHIFGAVPDIPTHPNVAMVYYFEDSHNNSDADSSEGSSVKVPDTGLFTTDNKGLIAGISITTITSLASAFYLLRYIINRKKAKVHFGKK